MKCLKPCMALVLLCAGLVAHAANAVANLPLLEAVTTGSRSEVEQLLRQGADPNTLGEQGQTALHVSSAMARFGVVKMLLDHGADPNLRDHKGMTPLIAATGAIAESNAVEATVSLLLDRGADPNPTGVMLSPLAFAMQRDHKGAITALKDAGAILAASESASMLIALQELNRNMKSAIFAVTRKNMTESEFVGASSTAIQAYRDAMLSTGVAIPESTVTKFVEDSREQYRNVLMQASQSSKTK